MSGFFGEERTVPGHKSVEWYTPAWVFEELGLTFDLDPSSPHDMETAVPATTNYTIFDDGLKKPWFGRVWLNPPYGPLTGMWMARMADHANGIALVFSRTDAAWCQEAMRKATAVLFMAGRIEFVPGKENRHKKARCGAGTALFAFGNDCAEALRRMSDRGVFLQVRNHAWTCPACGRSHDSDINAAVNFRNNAVSSTVAVCGEEGACLRRKTKTEPAAVKRELSFIPV